jgi:hypothetical protein
MSNTELVLTAPIQIKPVMSPPNLYDLTVADFYAKSRRLQGFAVDNPIIWNVNGRPIVKLATERGIDIEGPALGDFITTCIHSATSQFQSYGLSFSQHIRDDQQEDPIRGLLDGTYAPLHGRGDTIIAICPACRIHFGSDLGVAACRYCGTKTSHIPENVLFLDIDHEELLSRATRVNWIPASALNRLRDFITSMPATYRLILSKPRGKAIAYDGLTLDPRYSAILCYALMRPRRFTEVTLIHGDVTKKLDYYLFCYLDAADAPQRIVMHAPCLGSDGKKLRWADRQDEEPSNFGISPRVLRCIFLRREIERSIILSQEALSGASSEPTKLYLKSKKMLQMEPCDQTANLAAEQREFFRLANAFRLPLAYKEFERTVNEWWLKSKYQPLTQSEFAWLETLCGLYFGV